MSLFVANWIPIERLGGLLFPLWSISVEEQFYLIWQPIVKFGGKTLALALGTPLPAVLSWQELTCAPSKSFWAIKASP